MSAKSWGIEPVELLTPQQVKDKVPYINEQLILGGFFTPGAGVVDSLRAGTIMRERAQEAGMKVSANTEVLGIDVEHGRATRVKTTRGDFDADLIVIACGAWSPRIARMAGASIPLTPMVHQMIDIGPAPRFANTTGMIEYPIVRDMDTNMYERQEGTGLEIGSYAHRPITLDADDIPSIEESALTPTELPFTQEDFDPQMEIALELMPEIVADETVGVKYAINGVLSVTYDGMPLLGETPETRGLWSAAAIWIKEGPGAGKTVAELIVHGESEIDVFESNVARAYSCQRTKTHITARASEGFNKMYGIVHPGEQWASDRNVRLSPFYERERQLERCSSRPSAGSGRTGTSRTRRLLDEYGDRITRREAEWDSRWWSPIINAEHLAMRDRAAMIDLSAFAIFDVVGPGALQTVQNVAMRQMDVEIGRVVYTPLLAPSGGFKQDLTIMRLADDVFRVVTGGAYGMSDKKWFADHLPDDGSAQIHDQTNAWTTLGLWGPRARDILSSVTATTSPTKGCRSRAASTIEVGPVAALASRISYVGDLGWELYVPIEQGARLWDIVAEAGEPHGIIPAGIGVYGTTGRLEKCYRAYGAELEGDFNVVEAGHGVGQGQGPGLRRQGGARAPPRGGARRDHVHPHGRRPHLVLGRQALHARPRADRHARRRTAHRPQGPPLVRDERGLRARRSASTS